MNFSRRNFIKIGSTAVAGVVAGSSFDRPIFAWGEFGQSAGVFKKYVGSEFSLAGETSAIPVVLTEVREISTRGKQTTDCFSLAFRAPLKFKQDTYALSHPAFGNFHLFLVPGETSNGTAVLHAVFNRI